jgi:hypothetical protein
MKTKSLVKALEKVRLNVESKENILRDWITGEVGIQKEYWCKGKKDRVHWYDQEGNAVCVKVQKIGECDDSQRDYFPGFFADTIKEVVMWLTKE